MTELEKVVLELERFQYNFERYITDWSPVTNALALLRAQEPRVMTKSEVKQYLSIASNGFQAAEVDEPPLWTEYKNPQKYDVKWVTFGTAYSWMDDWETSSDYGTEFRFWTSRPTPEQMASTPWEGSEADGKN